MSEDDTVEQQVCGILGHVWQHWAGDRWLIGWAVCLCCEKRTYFEPTSNPHRSALWPGEKHFYESGFPDPEPSF